jgi:hypothetical protein
MPTPPQNRQYLYHMIHRHLTDRKVDFGFSFAVTPRMFWETIARRINASLYDASTPGGKKQVKTQGKRVRDEASETYILWMGLKAGYLNHGRGKMPWGLDDEMN